MSDARLSTNSPEASAEELQRRLDEMRVIVRDRPAASIYVSVHKGMARILLPSGFMEIVTEGEGLRIWPGYFTRREAGDA